MDPQEQREALSRLESDYLRGAVTDEDYERQRDELLEIEPSITVTDEDALAPVAPSAASLEIDPVTGARLASWGRRAAAWILDAFLVVCIWVAALVYADSTVEPATGLISDVAAWVIVVAVFLFAPVYQWLMVGICGATFAKLALGMRVRRAEDAGDVALARAFGRMVSTLLLGVLILPLLLAYLWPLWDDRGQTLYDKLVKTIVVRVR